MEPLEGRAGEQALHSFQAGIGKPMPVMWRPRAWGYAPHAPGRGRQPPGHTRVPCEELADGVDLREFSPKARTGPRPTPRWSAERRRVPRSGTRTYEMDAPLGAPSPRLCEGDEKDDGLPGAGKECGR